MNAKKLKYRLAEQDKKMSDMEKALGISKTALYRKMIGQSEFTCAEIQGIIHFLNLSREETMDIFFEEKVS